MAQIIFTGNKYVLRPLNPSPDYFPKQETATVTLHPRIRLLFVRRIQNEFGREQDDSDSSPEIYSEDPEFVTAVLDYSMFSDTTSLERTISNYLIKLDITRQGVHSKVTEFIIDLVREYPFPIMDEGATFGMQINIINRYIRVDDQYSVAGYEETVYDDEERAAANSNSGMVGASRSAIFKVLTTERSVNKDNGQPQPRRKRKREQQVDDIEDDERECCSICMDDIPIGAYLSKMPCHHPFHGQCIVKWLRTSHFCPVCRFEIPTT